MNNISIRKATTEDVVSIALLARVTFREAFGHLFTNNQNLVGYFAESFSIKALTEKIRDKNNVYWLALLDNLPVGYAKLIKNSPSHFINDTQVSELQRIYVLNDFLNKKIGHQLQDAVFKDVKSLKSNHLWLSVYIGNLKAIRFYERYNYKQLGTHSFGILNESFDFYVMNKEF